LKARDTTLSSERLQNTWTCITESAKHHETRDAVKLPHVSKHKTI